MPCVDTYYPLSGMQGFTILEYGPRFIGSRIQVDRDVLSGAVGTPRKAPNKHLAERPLYVTTLSRLIRIADRTCGLSRDGQLLPSSFLSSGL
jgi:hypothetical protein